MRRHSDTHGGARWWPAALLLTWALQPSSVTAKGLPMPADSTARYVGTERCGACHAHAFGVWSGSDHARSGLMLDTRRGVEVKRLSETHTGPAADLDCEACHRPPSRSVRAVFSPHYYREDGVQCEICHGPGGEHDVAEVAKDTLDGHRIFVPHKNADLCQACHYSEKPLHDLAESGLPRFDYDKWWKRIEHHPPPDGASK